MGSPYDYCPECGARGVRRERRINGNDECERGHVYPSVKPLKEPRCAEASHVEKLEQEIAELRDAVADADRKWAEARIEATRVKMDAHGLRKAYERAYSRLVALGEHPPTYDDSEEEA